MTATADRKANLHDAMTAMATPQANRPRIVPELYEVITRGSVKRMRIHAHWGQKLILRSTKRYTIAICGSQAGKTSIFPPWTHQQIRRYPACTMEGDGDHIVSAPTYGLLDAKLVPYYEAYFCTPGRGIEWGTFSRSRMMIFSKTDKSRIVFRSAENPEALEAFTARSAACDEYGMASVSVIAWEAIQRRLRTTEGNALIGTTPYTLGWLRQGPYKLAKGGHLDYALVSFPSDANPTFTTEQMEAARAELPDWKFRMMHLGEFTRPAGLIYGDYEDAYTPQERDVDGRWLLPDPSRWTEGIHGHLVRPFAIPMTWLRSVGVDFGGTEHTALTWWAEEPGAGNHYAYREALGGGLSGQEHARAALEYKEPVKMWVGGSSSEDDARESWARAGVPVIEPFFPGVEEGIDRLVALFRGRRAFVFETLTGLRSELGTYSRELDDSGEPTMKIEHKERFHGLDSARYWASTVPFDRPKAPKEEPSYEGRTLAAYREDARQRFGIGKRKAGREEYA